MRERRDVVQHEGRVCAKNWSWRRRTVLFNLHTKSCSTKLHDVCVVLKSLGNSFVLQDVRCELEYMRLGGMLHALCCKVET